jgi:hypothetical protein
MEGAVRHLAARIYSTVLASFGLRRGTARMVLFFSGFIIVKLVIWPVFRVRITFSWYRIHVLMDNEKQTHCS